MKENKDYGVRYHYMGENFIDGSRHQDLYTFATYHGKHSIKVNEGDSVVVIRKPKEVRAAELDTEYYAEWIKGKGQTIDSDISATVLRGYKCGYKLSAINMNTNLPYINGCSTRQIFPPERIGDPTLQQLTIPPHTSEQAHHIHPTARVVYVVSGRGYSVVGQEGSSEEVELVEGMTCIFDPMSPHHFRTEESPLTVLPLHIYSSGPENMESNHPMRNGTKEI